MNSDTSMRVVHVIPSLHIGGTERQLVGYITRSTDPEAHLVTTFDDLGPLAGDLPVPPVLLGPVARRSWRMVPSLARVIWDLRKQIVAWQADVVHAHLGAAEIVSAMAIPSDVPLVASRRGRNVGFERSRWLHVVEGIGHRRVDLMACNSQYLATFTTRHDLWPPPLVVVHNGIDIDRFIPTPMPVGTPIVAFVANAYPYKRHDLFLEAFRALREGLPWVQAVVVGRAADVVRPRVGDLLEAGAIRLVGEVEDTRPYLAEARLIALTSEHEGFPNALLEAMASGRPVVSTAVGGVTELVRDGVDGLLVPPDGRGLAEAMARILGDRDLGVRMGSNARRRAEEFGWERAVRAREAIYVQAMEARRRAHRSS
jgi:glycosyltransferase involved in cell wall biosynthesis